MSRLFTKSGHDFYVVSSLLQKAIRRGDYKRAGYAAKELYWDYPDFVWNRLLVISAEDCSAPITDELVALRKCDKWVNKGKKRDEKTKIFVGKAIVLLLECYKGREADFIASSAMREVNPEMRNDPAFNQELESLNIDKLVEEGKLFPDYVYDPHTAIGKYGLKRTFKNYDFDYIEGKDLSPKPKQMSIFEGEEYIYDDMYDENENKTNPGYEYTPKKFGEK